MARPKEFDPSICLIEVMEAFWERGYEATSLSDITERTGVQKASLYATYGDKHTLFLAALDQYQDASFERLATMLRGSTPRAALKGLFAEVVKNATAKDGRRGCLCVNTAVELAPHDPEIAARLRTHATRVESLLEATIEQAKAAGEVRPDLHARNVARFLLSAIYGLSVSAKSAPGAKKLQEVAAVTLSVLD